MDRVSMASELKKFPTICPKTSKVTRRRRAMAIVGVISDTHSLLRDEAKRALEGSELIIHAGDIGSQEVIDHLSEIAPVKAVRGNIDKSTWAERYSLDEVIEVEGRYLYVIHDIKEIDLNPAAAGFDVVISGHSHQPSCEKIDGVLYLNPGSAGHRRFKLPITLATLNVTANIVKANIHELVT